MKWMVSVCSLALMSTAVIANADSFLRIKCDDKDIGAEVFLNEKFMGNCPVDIPAQEGIVELRARKIVDDDHEQLFKKQIRVVEGVPQRIELMMSAPQLTAEAIHKKEASEANAQLSAAEAGNIASMKKIADYYDAGMGVAKDSSRAAAWRDKAEAATAQSQLGAANAGDIQAMENIAARYDIGRGVNKDSVQAKIWREKADVAKREKIALENARKEKEAAAEREKIALENARKKQARIDNVSFFQSTKTLLDPKEGTRVFGSSYYTSLPLSTFYGLLFDLTSAPSRTTEIHQLKNEAALRPSTWGKPDSMIARASHQIKHESTL